MRASVASTSCARCSYSARPSMSARIVEASRRVPARIRSGTALAFTRPDYSHRAIGTLGIGIVGAGRHGLRSLRHLTEDVPDATLVALCRRDRREGEATAAAFHCAFYDDWHALIDDPRIDAVVTAVPPGLNA